MITLATVVQTPTEVLATDLHDDEIVLLHFETQRYYTLNATGSHIWRSLLAGLSVKEASRQLEATFDVTPQEAQQVTLALVQELADQTLVKPVVGTMIRDS
jgi:hypothetical protein